MKLLCKLFGHKWVLEAGYTFCWRCRKDYNDLNRSDLDESENVFPEKWLDKHMD
ncbi:DUF1660 domain-containing protein [Lactococcus lactis]|uniref:DUF1660 domain-containing protein n=1 Tax=Lactococcus lactis TaxID=1358 RepID=UPI00071C1F52|nr:DUF1660 domain-containing protein [Lactococcus lactis]